MLAQTNLLTAFRQQVEFLEKCLSYPNAKYTVIAHTEESTHGRQISSDETEQKKVLLKQKIDKVNNLLQKLVQGQQENQSELLYFVKSSFLLGEIIQTHWDCFLGEEGKRVIQIIMLTLALLCTKLKMHVTPDTPPENVEYIILETLKYNLNSTIDVGLKTHAFTQEYVRNFKLGDMTPKESESVLIFLSTMKKWEPVYKRLAVS